MRKLKLLITKNRERKEMFIRGKDLNKLVSMLNIALIVTLVRRIKQVVINLKKQSDKAS